MEGTLRSIHASPEGGIRKPSVPEARLIVDWGIEGDRSARHERVPKWALCLYSVELYAALREEGYSLGPGDLAENLLFEGIDFGEIEIGDRFQIGDEAVIEISSVRTPCGTLTPLDERLPKGLIGRSGFMAYVREGGIVRPGDPIRHIGRAETASA